MNNIFKNVKITGRTHYEDDVLWLCHSGSGVSFRFTGTYAEITMKADENYNRYDENMYARIAVYLNGKRIIDELLDSQEKVFRINASSDCVSHVDVIKLSECVMSLAGIINIKSDSDLIMPADDKKHKIEFIGDSITCGYGIDDECREHTFSTKTEDFTRTYAFKTAQTLEADYSVVSYSGYGIISGYTSDSNINTKQLIMPHYDYSGFMVHSDKSDITSTLLRAQWDFSSFVPDAVVLNIGTNDYSYCREDQKRQDDFVNNYVISLKKIRSRNPEALIVCCSGIMDSSIFCCVAKAAKKYQSVTGDDRICSLELPYQTTEDGLAADWHPTEKSNIRAAKVLSDFIKEKMKW